MRALLLPLILVLILSGCNLKRSEPPNVILMVLDTLRADHLGFYGYERDTSPNLDTFARENLAFKYALTAAPWTPPSVASIFTGMYAVTHGMMPPNERDEARKALSRLDENLLTLSDIFKQNGYSTAGITPNPWTNTEFGYNQGFDQYRYLHRVRADEISRAGSEMVDKLLENKKPFFLYLHYLDPHDPYDPPDEYRTMFEGTVPAQASRYSAKMARNIGLYDGEIRYMDNHIGKFFDYLKNRGLYDKAVIVIVGDHGEQFMEHGDHRHGFKLYNDELHVPLFIKTGTKIPARQIETTVSTIDIYPTVMQLCGIKIPDQIEGISLIDSDNLHKRDGVLSEINRRYNMKSFTDYNGKKIIVNATSANDQPLVSSLVGVFDWRIDYLELAPQKVDKQIEDTLFSELKKIHADALKSRIHTKAPEADVSQNTIEQLKSLGYLQ